MTLLRSANVTNFIKAKGDKKKNTKITINKRHWIFSNFIYFSLNADTFWNRHFSHIPSSTYTYLIHLLDVCVWERKCLNGSEEAELCAQRRHSPDFFLYSRARRKRHQFHSIYINKIEWPAPPDLNVVPCEWKKMFFFHFILTHWQDTKVCHVRDAMRQCMRVL